MTYIVLAVRSPARVSFIYLGSCLLCLPMKSPLNEVRGGWSCITERHSQKRRPYKIGQPKSNLGKNCYRQGRETLCPYGNAKVVTSKVVTRWSQGCSIVTRLLQACYHFIQNTKVVTSLVTRLSNGYNIVTRLLHHVWLQLTSTCSVLCIALLLRQHPNGCQGCI